MSMEKGYAEFDFEERDEGRERKEREREEIEEEIEEEREIEERDRRRDIEIEKSYNSMRTTSTPTSARSKTGNYDQILSGLNRREVENNFPEIKSSVIIRQIEGKIQLSIFGSNEWTDLRKPDGKINSFRGELKKALGPLIKKLESDYFIKLKRFFPYMNEKDFELIYGKDQLRIRMRGERGEGGVALFKKNGELKARIDTKLRNKLGLTANEIIAEEKIENVRDQEKINKYREDMRRTNITSDELAEASDLMNATFEKIREREENVGNIKDGIALNEEEINEEETIEDVEGDMKLKDRIKAIFKKYGLTITAVTSAVITVISAIVSNLGIGLSKLAKNLGNGLKEIGKKLATLLPGMVGAIASFIFNTAGEAIGFLAKHAWLLIIAVVIAAVDRFKKKNK